MFELRPFVRNHHSVLPHDPFRDLADWERAFFASPFSAENGMNLFGTDISEDAGSYLLETDLPGFRKEDIHLDLNGDTLTVSAERKSESENKEGGCIRRERCYGSYSRSFDVSEVDTEGITAKYEDGVLHLTLPKKEKALPESRRLLIQ